MKTNYTYCSSGHKTIPRCYEQQGDLKMMLHYVHPP